MKRPVPCLLERRLLPKVWGGRSLERVLGISLPSGAKIGESWEAFDRPDGSSPLRDHDGATLHDLIAEDARSWLGARFAQAQRFPLILKFIDAREALSVQLHPDDEQAVGDAGKNEAWVVLAAGQKARIVRGLRQGVDAQQVALAAGKQTIESLLHTFRPVVGQAVLIPSGTVHAIGPDVVVFEVQQNSDLTYRLWDWGRERELHTAQALAALRVPETEEPDIVEPEPCDGGSWLIRHQDFSVRRYALSAPRALPVESDFKLLTALAGQGTVGWRSGGNDAPLFVQRGDTLLVPAALEQVFVSPIGRLDLLWTAPGAG